MSNIPLRRASDSGGRISLRLALAVWVMAAVWAQALGAEESESKPAADKSGFTLFNPTPVALMREFNPDRPDFTESPFTVDAGHFQLETSFFDFTRHTAGGMRTDVTVYGSFNAKLGLLNNTDLEFLLDPYTVIRTHGPGASTTVVRGVGDALIRLKVNFWGNDGPTPGTGPTAFGILPFVKIPTADREIGNRRVEGGVILPLAVNLPADFDLSAMIEVDFLRNEANTHYGTEYVQSLSIGHPIVGPLAGYVEYVGMSPVRTGSVYRAYFSAGLTYKVGKNMEFDAGTLVGMSHKSDAFNVFSGFTVRF